MYLITFQLRCTAEVWRMKQSRLQTAVNNFKTIVVEELPEINSFKITSLEPTSPKCSATLRKQPFARCSSRLLWPELQRFPTRIPALLAAYLQKTCVSLTSRTVLARTQSSSQAPETSPSTGKRKVNKAGFGKRSANFKRTFEKSP